MDWFLRSLLPPIGKDVASHFLQTEEAALQIALKYDLIYAQSGYVYTVLPDLPKPGGPNASRASHSVNGIIGAVTHTPAQPLLGYGFPSGGAIPSGTFPLLGSMYPGYRIPPPFAHTPAYLNVAHPTPYPYPHPLSQHLQHLDLPLPCLLHPHNRTYYPLQGKYLHSRGQLIFFLLK